MDIRELHNIVVEKIRSVVEEPEGISVYSRQGDGGIQIGGNKKYKEYVGVEFPETECLDDDTKSELQLEFLRIANGSEWEFVDEGFFDENKTDVEVSFLRELDVHDDRIPAAFQEEFQRDETL